MDFSLGIVSFLILFPFVMAGLLTTIKNNRVRKPVVYTGSGIIIVATILAAIAFFANGSRTVSMLKSTHGIDMLMICVEFLLMALIIYLSFKHKKYYAAVLSVVQTVAIAWFELTHPAEHPSFHISIDRLSVILGIIVGVIGCLICMYAVGYMTGYHHHHTEYKDRRTFFFPMLFVFIGAMFGLVLSDNLIWIYFFWEITSVSSFLLIGYTKTEEAVNNSFRALWMNLLGGVAFAAGIIMFSLNGIHNLSEIIANHNTSLPLFDLAVALLALAGLTKSAQLPFSKWLLGAMVAPTPTSALLHSATMVKAGVYLLLRLSPVMHGNWSGYMVSLIGGFTFLVASMLAITHSDGKKILAYSTISNLGLITACAGIGFSEAAWSGILLLIFHAVSKSMLFQAVGAIENASGSRDVETMHGLIIKLPRLAYIMIIGIAGMFLAPFGMLISKWVVLKSLIDSSSILGIILVFFICFGSATTLFYWTKWLCKVMTYDVNAKHIDDTTRGGQWFSLATHAVLMILLCALLSSVSKHLLMPYVIDVFEIGFDVIHSSDILIMVAMLFVVIIVPVFAIAKVKSISAREGLNYISGINLGDNTTFTDSFKGEKKTFHTNWYLTDVFGEHKLWKPSVYTSVAYIIVCLVASFLTGGIM